MLVYMSDNFLMKIEVRVGFSKLESVFRILEYLNLSEIEVLYITN